MVNFDTTKIKVRKIRISHLLVSYKSFGLVDVAKVQYNFYRWTLKICSIETLEPPYCQLNLGGSDLIDLFFFYPLIRL
jgi:hypothetical protein